MRTLDKTALLFEMLLGSDMANVNRKIDEIRFSPEYIRVANFIPESSNSEIGKDIVQRFNSIDIYGVMSMQRILEVEKEIKELDRRIQRFTPINPYLANGTEQYYRVNRVGDISVEISAQGMKLDEFTSKEGIKTQNRRKVLKHKLFGWYIEAKKGIAESIDNSKLMLSRVRQSKIKIKSISFQNILLTIITAVLAGLMIFAPQFAEYRAGTMDTTKAVISTIGLYAALLLTFISTIIVLSYKTYPFKIASKLRKQIVKQRNLVSKLDSKSYSFEKSVIHSSKNPFKMRQTIKNLSILNNTTNISNQELFDYLYSEKEYFMQHRKAALLLHNIIFAIGLVVAVFSIIFITLF